MFHIIPNLTICQQLKLCVLIPGNCFWGNSHSLYGCSYFGTIQRGWYLAALGLWEPKGPARCRWLLTEHGLGEGRLGKQPKLNVVTRLQDQRPETKLPHCFQGLWEGTEWAGKKTSATCDLSFPGAGPHCSRMDEVPAISSSPWLCLIGAWLVDFCLLLWRAHNHRWANACR